MPGVKRVRVLALPVVLGVALLCAGAAQARGQAGPWSVAIAVTGPGTITGPGGISCSESGGNCVGQFADGTVVTLTATPGAGASLQQWYGDCTGTGTTCTLTMNSHKSVGAAFTTGGGGGGDDGDTVGLSLNVSGAGTVSGPGISCGNGSTDCSELYATGSTVTLTATPASGQSFTGWGGACSGTGTTCTLSMDQARTVTAAFGAAGSTATLTITVTGNGKVTGPGIDCGLGGTDCVESYSANTAVTLTETPGTGATFSGWGGSCSGTAATCTVTLTANKTVSAAFTGSTAQGTLTVTVTGSGRVVGAGIDCGQGNTDCTEVYAANTTVTLAEIPASGATFAGWGGSCSGQTTTCTVVVTGAKAVTATFTQGSTQKILTVTVSGSGRVSGPGISCGASSHDCSSAFNDGALATIRATPADGATFLGWGGACSGTAPTCTVLMNAPRAVSASFSRPGTNTTAPFTARSLGNPSVTRTSVGWAVSLRFFTNRSASALLRLSLNGGLVSAFTFSPHAGNVTVGPFNVARPGNYRFRLTLTDAGGNVQELVWNACLSDSCGTFRPAGAFVAARAVTATRTAGGWIVHVRFQAAGSGAATIRMTRAGRLVTGGSFTFHRGAVVVNLPARQAGLHTIVLTTRNAAGRVYRITWNALLS